MEEAPSDMANWKQVRRDCRSFYNLKDYRGLSTFFQEPAFPVCISVGANNGTRHTVKSLLDTYSEPNLVKSSFLPPYWWSYITILKALTLDYHRANSSRTRYRIPTYMYERFTSTGMARYCRGPCAGPIPQDIIHLQVCTWHLPSPSQIRANTFSPRADSHVSTKDLFHTR